MIHPEPVPELGEVTFICHVPPDWARVRDGSREARAKTMG